MRMGSYHIKQALNSASHSTDKIDASQSATRMVQQRDDNVDSGNYHLQI